MKKLRKSHLLIVGGILLIFLAAGLFDQPLPVLAFLEQKGLDLRFRLRGEQAPGGQVVVAGIEAKGIAAYGRWPWRRFDYSVIGDNVNLAARPIVHHPVPHL